MALPKRYRRSGNGKLVVAAGRYLEGWIPLRGQGGLSLASGKLERLDTLDPSLQKDLPAFHEQAVAAVQRRGEVYGVPHHLDFGFYAVRSDLLGCDVDQPDGDRELMTVTTEQGTKTLSLDESWTWNEIYELWRAVAKARRTQRAKARIDGSVGVTSDLGSHSFDLRALDCSSNQVDESYLCFILEVLWPWLQKEEGVVDIERLTSECVLEATCEMYRQLNRLNVLPMRLSGRSDDVDERSVTEGDQAPHEALIQRHWFVSYQKVIRANRQLERKLRRIPPPMLSVLGGTGGERARSIRGDWFLGVVKGSPNPRRGLWAIQALTNETTNRQMYHGGLGLPARNVLLEFGEARDWAKWYSNSVSRRLIPQYYQVHSILIDGFAEIFGRRYRPSDLREAESATYRHMDREIRRVSCGA